MAFPFDGGRHPDAKGKLSEQDLYQAAHHELIASAMCVKLAHEIDPANKVGCMVLGLTSYPRTARSERCDRNDGGK